MHRIYLLLAAGTLLAGCQSFAPTVKTGDHLGVAQAAEESGDYGMAETIYARAASAAPSDASLQLRYADMLIKQGKISQARDLLAQHVKTVSDAQSLHGALGMLDVLQGQPAQAMVEFDSMTTDPLRWAVNKGVALDMLGRHSEAQALYQRFLAAQPDDVVVLTDLALSLALSGRTAEANRIAAPLLDRTDLPPRVQTSLGIVQAANGDLPGAHRALGATVTDQQLLVISDAMKRSAMGL
jgi:Flp pilus assembly protein TadD